MKVTERSVQIALAGFVRNGSGIVIPNSELLGHEADLLLILPSNYCHEYEVKLTSADFKNEGKARSKIIKHQDMQRCAVEYIPNYYSSPNFFHYVAPAGIIDPNALYEKYGLIEFVEAEGCLQFTVKKKCKRIHSGKITEAKIRGAARSLSHKVFNAMRENPTTKA